MSISAFGIYNFRYNKSSEDYFLGGRNSPWWVAMFSIVATETSVLTFVSIPGLAYRSDWFFLQLAMGYIVGRIFVAIFLLPLYFKGKIISIYEIIGDKFGVLVQKIASSIFLVTRLLADGIRFLATAVVVQVVTGWPIWVAVLIIGCITMLYTLFGGMRTVLWVDTFQFILYLFGGIIIILYITSSNSFIGWEPLIKNEKLSIFHFNTKNIFMDPWYFWSAFFGGTLLSFASHGADYMMVQRVLTCIDLKSARKAMIGSGVFVFIQFSVFLIAGSLIWVYLDGMVLEKDRELSTFIVNYLPIGVKGLLLAGVISAAMSTLSSSINSLASSTVNDWMNSKVSIKTSFVVSAIWAILLILIAIIFDEGNTAVVILGLKIASFTYGGLLSLFLLSQIDKPIPSLILIIGLFMSFLSVFLLEFYGIAWTWYIGVAVFVNLFTVFILTMLSWLKIIFLTSLVILYFIFSFRNEHYSSGLNELINQEYALLQNKRVGLVVNHTSVDREGVHLIDRLNASSVSVEAIFSPEHGFSGKLSAGEIVKDSIDIRSGVKIYSLYGKNKKPTYEMLKDIELLIFDIQDIGVRYYTYLSTMTYVLEAAAENQIPVLILDRLNPLGREVSGSILADEYKSFVGMHPIPIRHGLTIGELANMINGEGWLVNDLKADITVFEYSGTINKTAIKDVFIPRPSPNMPDYETAWLYQGLCLLEGTNLSEGRGTDTPFKVFGAPWLDSKGLYQELMRVKQKNDKFSIAEFTPESSASAKRPKYMNKKCFGIRVDYLENPINWTIHLFELIYNMHPDQFKFLDNNFIDKLYGKDDLRNTIISSLDISDLFNKMESDKLLFEKQRDKYLIYNK